MKRALQILTHKGMINGELACGKQAYLPVATVYPQIYYFCHMKQKTHSKFFIPDYLGTLPDKRLEVRA
ncbi:MAG: hypothetical protein ACYC0A_12740, partial [Lutibacter sp.]